MRTPPTSVSLWIPLAAFLVTLALGEPELRLKMTSSHSGISMVFFPGLDGVLVEGGSAMAVVPNGEAELRFPLPLGARSMRWDPLDGPGEFVFGRAWIDAPFWSIRLDPARFIARYQIQRISPEGDRVLITTTADAKDPALGINLPWVRILFAQLGVAAALALLAGLLMRAAAQPAARTAAARALTWARVNARHFNDVPKLVLIAAVFWFSSFASYMISVDEEAAMLRQDQGVWVGEGRWTIYLLTRFVVPQPVVPYVLHALFCLFASVAYVLLLRAHGMARDKRSLLLFPVFAAFPVWFFIAEFYENLFSAGVGLLLIAVAAAVFQTFVVAARPGWKRLLTVVAVEAVLVGTATGAFQSYLLGFTCIGLGVILVAATRTPAPPLRAVLEQVGALAAATCASAVFYAGVGRLFLWGLGLQLAYIQNYLKPAVLLANPLSVVDSTVREALNVYSGSSSIYGAGFAAAGALMTLGSISIVRMVKGHRRVLVAAVATACAAVPFALSLVAGGGMTIPYRALVGVPYVVWLFAAFAIHDRRAAWRAMTMAALAATAVQLMFLHSAYIAAIQLALEHDKALTAQIYGRVVEKFPDFNRQLPHQVDLYGSKSLLNAALLRIPLSTVGRSFFDWPGCDLGCRVRFMQLIGYEGLVPIEPDRVKTLMGEWANMPSWPSEQSVRKVGEVVLIKLGDYPDFSHRF